MAPQLAQAQYAPQAKVIGAGAGGLPRQGSAIALSADGRTLIVGGPFATLSGQPSGAVGAAFVFTRRGASWTQEAMLVGGVPDPFLNMQQGYSVALSDNGDTALVGAPGDFFTRGEARVFVRRNGRWTEQAALYTTDGRLAFQGRGVALSGDGNTAILGGYNDNGGDGAAWVFIRAGGAWTQQGGKLMASDAIGGAWQGWSVALSGDGHTALVGGPNDNGGVGASWTFELRDDGTWRRRGPKLVGNDAAGPARQGFSVSLNNNGNIAIVGGPDDNGGAGASWVFQRRRGAFAQEGAKLVGAGAVGAAQQGASVTISGNGATALVGGPGDNSAVGAAWSFTRWLGSWRQQGSKLVGAQSLGAAAQGTAVALSNNGNIAAVGGPRDNDGVGATWIYIRSFAGTPLVASCYSQSLQALASRFGGMNTAAWSLGYGMARVAPLESAVHAYCGDPSPSDRQG